jgi:hypothetical protein
MKSSKVFAPIVVSIVVCFSFLSCIKPPPAPDYDLYENMRIYMQQKFEEMAGFAVRDDIAAYYDNYVLTLRGLPRLVFGSRKLQIHLSSGDSDYMAVASISQFEVPPGSGNFTDVAFAVRPNANLRAPFMHGDALKGMAGMDTSFSMDFWNVNQDAIDWETFFGDQVALLDQGHALVEPYQRTGEDRGAYTQHLIPYKWEKYRIEIEEPETDDETVRKAYHDAAYEAFKLYADAYMTALARLQPEADSALIEGTKEGTAELMEVVLAEDPAAQLGLLLFGDEEEFEKYFLDAFWRADYYGPGL